MKNNNHKILNDRKTDTKNSKEELINLESHSDHINFSIDKTFQGLYDFNDIKHILNLEPSDTYTGRIYSLEKLLERDKLREKDGFPRKIKIGRLVKPSKDGDNKIIIVPTATEEKLFHWEGESDKNQGSPTGGSGDESEGEIIGEVPLRPDEGEGEGSGQGKGGKHGMGAEAYEVGKILTEQFELPNIKEKGRKTSLTKEKYELSDINRGHGQLLDKKATLKRVVKTNLALGRINSKKVIDTSNIIIPPRDHVYRILSKEKDFDSQAIVFFVRDYSGSMQGKSTEVVVTQHVYIHSWLVYQYKKQVISRFIVHDTDAVEVPDFYTYYNKQVAGGTEVAYAYELVNKIVQEENLQRDYNIYMFHGTDGDDWNEQGDKAKIELEKIIQYSSRVGITIAENTYSSRNNTTVEKYIKSSKLLERYPDIIHLDSFRAVDADEERIIKGIKILIS
jgi:hypothetical protein